MRIGRKGPRPNPDDSTPSDSSEGQAVPSLDDGGLAAKYSAPKEFDWSKVRNKHQRVKDEKTRLKVEDTATASHQVADDASTPNLKIGGKTIKQEHAIAGAAVGVVLAIAVVYYYMRSTNDLAPALTVDQAATIKTQQQQEDRETLRKLIKEVGPDHPQVLQMKMELGDVPFPSVNK